MTNSMVFNNYSFSYFLVLMNIYWCIDTSTDYATAHIGIITTPDEEHMVSAH